jgi:hypothetical protein
MSKTLLLLFVILYEICNAAFSDSAAENPLEDSDMIDYHLERERGINGCRMELSKGGKLMLRVSFDRDLKQDGRSKLISKFRFNGFAGVQPNVDDICIDTNECSSISAKISRVSEEYSQTFWSRRLIDWMQVGVLIVILITWKHLQQCQSIDMAKCDVSFAFLALFIRFGSNACPSDSVKVSGETYAGGSAIIYNGDANGVCHFFIDCTFTSISNQVIRIVANSDAVVYASGCAFTTCVHDSDTDGGYGGCFYGNAKLRVTVIRTCTNNCGCKTRGTFIYCDKETLGPSKTLKEISSWKSYGTTQGAWIGWRTTGVCFTNVNVSSYSPPYIGGAGTIFGVDGGYDGEFPLTFNFFLMVDCSCSGGPIFSVSANKGFYSLTHCALIDCAGTSQYGIFVLWNIGKQICFRNCLFKYTGTLLAKQVASGFFILFWNCQFVGSPVSDGGINFDNVREYTNRPSFTLRVKGVCNDLYTLEEEENTPTPTGVLVDAWCSAGNEGIKLENGKEISKRETSESLSNNCYVIKFCSFFGIKSSANGGALNFNDAGASSAAYITESQFVSCSAEDNHEGGAVYLAVGRAILDRVCGTFCTSTSATFLSLKKSTGAIDFNACNLYDCSSTSGGNGVIMIDKGVLIFKSTNFSKCSQAAGASVLEYVNEETAVMIQVPGSCFIVCWQCSGEYGFYFKYHYIIQDYCVYIENEAKVYGWFRMKGALYLSFCSFHQHLGVLFSYETNTQTNLLQLVKCYVNGSFPSEITDVKQYDVDFVEENVVITLSIGAHATDSCYLLYLLTETFSPSDRFSLSTFFSSSQGFMESDKLAGETEQYSHSSWFDTSQDQKLSENPLASETFTASDDFSATLSFSTTNHFSTTGKLSQTEFHSVSPNLLQTDDNLDQTEAATKTSLFFTTNVFSNSASFTKPESLSDSRRYSMSAKILGTSAFGGSQNLSPSQSWVEALTSINQTPVETDVFGSTISQRPASITSPSSVHPQSLHDTVHVTDFITNVLLTASTTSRSRSSTEHTTSVDSKSSHNTEVKSNPSNTGGKEQQEEKESDGIALIVVCVILMVVCSVLFVILMVKERKEKERKSKKSAKQAVSHK